MINTSPLIQPTDFIARYSNKQIKNRKRFKIFCLSNPVGWIVGSLYLINNLFKKIILKAGGDALFGSSVIRTIRRPDLIEKFTTQMQGKVVRLQRPDGCIIEGMHIKGQHSPLNSTQQKTILLFTGSHASYEFYAVPMAKTYQEHGYNVLCINYAGFGQSQGIPSQSSIELDAEIAYQYIQQNNPNTEISAHGYSLGSYPATYLAKTYSLKKVVIDRGFSKISNRTRDVATQLYGHILGCVLKILVTYVGAMDNLKNVKASSSQFLCGRARDDDQYHVDLIRQTSNNVTVIDFSGLHDQDSHSTWFQNNTNFWEWLSQEK